MRGGGVRSFQSLSVEGVTQLQRFNTQLPHFSDSSVQPALGAWLQGSLCLCSQSLLTHLSVCLFYPLIASPIRNTYKGREQGSQAL